MRKDRGIVNYIYFLANASLGLHIIKYLNTATHLPPFCVTALEGEKGWIFKIKFDLPVTSKQDKDFQAFMSELGEELEADIDLHIQLWSLEEEQWETISLLEGMCGSTWAPRGSEVPK